jgi:invasion protein IalB
MAIIHRRILAGAVLAGLALAACLAPSPVRAQARPAGKAADTRAAASEPQKVNGASPAWTVTCVSHARATPVDCALEQRLFAKETGQLLSVAIISVPGAGRQPTLVLQLPTGLALQSGVSVTVDNGAPHTVPLQSCDGRGCFASTPVSTELLSAMQHGKVMTVHATSGSHEPLSFPHMLTDFSTAYDAAR